MLPSCRSSIPREATSRLRLRGGRKAQTGTGPVSGAVHCVICGLHDDCTSILNSSKCTGTACMIPARKIVESTAQQRDWHRKPRSQCYPRHWLGGDVAGPAAVGCQPLQNKSPPPPQPAAPHGSWQRQGVWCEGHERGGRRPEGGCRRVSTLPTCVARTLETCSDSDLPCDLAPMHTYVGLSERRVDRYCAAASQRCRPRRCA